MANIDSASSPLNRAEEAYGAEERVGIEVGDFESGKQRRECQSKDSKPGVPKCDVDLKGEDRQRSERLDQGCPVGRRHVEQEQSTR